MPASESFSGTVTPGGVQPGAVPSAVSAAPSCCAVGLLDGAAVAGASRLVAVQEPSPLTAVHAASGSVQTPSALPSMSHAAPSAHESFFDVVPQNATKQSVDDGPPPPNGADPSGQAAKAAGCSVTTRASATSRRMMRQARRAIRFSQSGAAEWTVPRADRSQEALATFAAWSPFGPCVTSNETRCPSSSVRNPLPAIAE